MKEESCITGNICMTKDIGTNGNLFGGIMMAWIDQAAAIFARRYTHEPRLVTLKYTEIFFKQPVKVSDMVEFYAYNIREGKTSLTFDLEGRVGKRQIIKTTCTFVAVDEKGRSKIIDAFQ